MLHTYTSIIWAIIIVCSIFIPLAIISNEDEAFWLSQHVRKIDGACARSTFLLSMWNVMVFALSTHLSQIKIHLFF